MVSASFRVSCNCVCDARILAYPTLKGSFQSLVPEGIPRRTEWRHQSCPWSWREVVPCLKAGYFFFAEKDAPHLGGPETQADLSQDLEGSGGQEGALALSGEVLESGAQEAKDAHDDELDSDLDPDDLDEDVQCPKEEETVRLPGSPECETCRYRIVLSRRRFKRAQVYGTEAASGTRDGETGLGSMFCFLLFRLVVLLA